MNDEPDHRRCVFCGRSPVTAEHVFRGKWGKLYGNNFVEREQTLVTLVDWQIVAESTQGPFQERKFEQRLRAVCGTCNNGWMNDLENEAEGELTQLFDGVSHDITPEVSRVIARWVAKTAVVIEQFTRAASRPPTVNEEQKHALRQGGPPPGFFTFMYRMEEAQEDTPTLYSRTSPVRFEREDGRSAIPGIDCSWGLVSIRFGRVMFICCHVPNPQIAELLRLWGFAQVLGAENRIESAETMPWPGGRLAITSETGDCVHDMVVLAAACGSRGETRVVVTPHKTFKIGGNVAMWTPVVPSPQAGPAGTG